MTEPDALYFLLQENISPSEPSNEGPSTSIPGALHAQVALLIFSEVLVCLACLMSSRRQMYCTSNSSHYTLGTFGKGRSSISQFYYSIQKT